jgi:hypothetical protein
MWSILIDTPTERTGIEPAKCYPNCFQDSFLDQPDPLHIFGIFLSYVLSDYRRPYGESNSEDLLDRQALYHLTIGPNIEFSNYLLIIAFL